MSSSDIFILAVVYDARSGRGSGKKNNSGNTQSKVLSKRLLTQTKQIDNEVLSTSLEEAWKGGEAALRQKRLIASFERFDIDRSGYLEIKEISAALASSGLYAREVSVRRTKNKD